MDNISLVATSIDWNFIAYPSVFHTHNRTNRIKKLIAILPMILLLEMFEKTCLTKVPMSVYVNKVNEV